ncbi:L-gulonolactone oxidase-like [Oppia nitens]|uniref:L-gulonolactone oxidase-like n=1 Tax=Oppia nitens TaxID=1686743 RepID=UPI0023DC9814|nr:L-gulonolactone oxidase-like [Oppia nitens]
MSSEMLEEVADIGVQAKGLKNIHFTNWSQTYSCQPSLYFIPKDIEELREIIFYAKSTNKKLRVVGCGHSPSDICCTDDYMINLRLFNNVLSINCDTNTVKVEAGITLTELNSYLDTHKLALPVLGSVSDITIGGVISTGTHGTGAKFGVLAEYVLDLELINTSGDTIKCSRNENSDVFLSALCGLGAIGIIVRLTIQCEPAFLLYEYTYPSTLDEILPDLDDEVNGCDHFRMLWFPHTNLVSVCNNNRIYNKEITKYSQSQKVVNWFCNYAIGYYTLEFAYWLSTYCQPLVPYINRLWFWLQYSRPKERIDLSNKVFNFECLFKQHVNEWSIPREKTAKVLLDLKHWIDTTPNIYVHFPVEIRFVKEDDIYLSPAFGRDSTFINIIMYRPYGKDVSHTQYWDSYEKLMKEAGGRPHWAKAHREKASDFVKMYPYFRAWTQVRKRLDPINLLINSYLNRVLMDS